VVSGQSGRAQGRGRQRRCQKICDSDQQGTVFHQQLFENRKRGCAVASTAVTVHVLCARDAVRPWLEIKRGESGPVLWHFDLDAVQETRVAESAVRAREPRCWEDEGQGPASEESCPSRSGSQQATRAFHLGPQLETVVQPENSVLFRPENKQLREVTGWDLLHSCPNPSTESHAAAIHREAPSRVCVGRQEQHGYGEVLGRVCVSFPQVSSPHLIMKLTQVTTPKLGSTIIASPTVISRISKACRCQKRK